MFNWNNFLVSECIFKIAANQRYIIWKRNFEQVTRVVYLHVILFRMLEKDTDTEKKKWNCITNHSRVRPNSEIQVSY